MATIEQNEDFEAVYEQYRPRLLRLVERGFSARCSPTGARCYAGGNRVDAEDVVQEAFRRFFEHYRSGRFDRSRPVAPYLRRIAMNVSIGQRRRHHREQLGVDVEPRFVDRTVDHRELQRLLEAFAGSLEVRDRAIFRAYFGDGTGSQARVGATLGLSRDQVARSVSRIRRRATRFFTPRGYGPL